jgi:phage shock protein PspC (stress-responsive transcriptional regulator)
MTETTTAAPPTGASRTLYRDPDDRMFAGVCAAIGRYTDTDPVIWRIVTVVLLVFGGSGGVLYLLGWLLIPKRAADGSIPETWIGRRGHRLRPTTIAIVALIALVVLGGFDDGRAVAAIAVLAVVGYLVHRDRQAGLGVPVSAAAPETVPWEPPPPYVRVPRERSRLGLLTVSLTAIVTGALVWAALAGVDALTPGRITAVALLIVGAGLVVGTWYGRARWLIAVGILLSLGVGTAVAADVTGATLHGGLGERRWVVADAGNDPTFALGIGEATLDLTSLPADGSPIVVHSKVSLGHLIIVVPDDVPIRVHAVLKIGDLTEFGTSLVSSEHRIERTRSYGPVGDPRVLVEANVGTGQIEVRHG